MKKILFILTLTILSLSACGQSTFKKGIETDDVSEVTSAHGVEIDGLVIKDGGIAYIDDSLAVHNDTAQAIRVDVGANTSSISSNTTNIVSIEFGDTVTANTYTTNDGSSYDLKFRGANGATDRSSSIKISSGDILMLSHGDSLHTYTHGGTEVGMYGQAILIGTIDSDEDYSYLQFDTTQMLIDDAINLKGLIYGGDYHTNYTNRSIPDKEYVDGVGVGSDTIPTDTVTHMLVDTLQAVFGYGADVAVGTLMGEFKSIQDSIIFDSITTQCFGADASLSLQVQYAAGLNSGGTGIHTAIPLTLAGGETGTSTFSTTIIGPGNWIWCEPTSVTTAPTHVVLILFYHEKRAY